MALEAIVGKLSIKDVIVIYYMTSVLKFNSFFFSNGRRACYGSAITCDVGDNKWYARESAISFYHLLENRITPNFHITQQRR
jgi:hypothetical protein